MKEIIHICYSVSAKGTIKSALKKGYLNGKNIICMNDDLSNGPINFLNSSIQADVLKERIQWNININSEEVEEIPEYIESNYKEFNEAINSIKDEQIYIWYANNGREMCGLLYTLPLIKDKLKNAYTINVSEMIYNTGLINEFCARWVGEMTSERLAELTTLKKQMNVGSYCLYEAMWKKLVEENSNLRISRQNEVISVSEDYFDNLILQYTEKSLKKCARTVGEVLGYNEEPVTDTFIFWRIMQLINENKIIYKGTLGIMREMEIKKH